MGPLTGFAGCRYWPFFIAGFRDKPFFCAGWRDLDSQRDAIFAIFLPRLRDLKFSEMRDGLMFKRDDDIWILSIL